MVLSSLRSTRVFSAPTIASPTFSSCSVRVRVFQRHFFRHMSVLPNEATAAAASESAAAVPSKDRNNTASGREPNPDDVLVQYVVLRRDLIDSWPLGSVVTQGCHASVAAVWSSRDDPITMDYCSDSNLDFMHKVTLEVKGEAQIVNLSEKLVASGILHKLWIEQPENIPTCLATKPYPKSVISTFFKKLKLCK